MNEYFEYMTGYAVLIVRAYIKMGVFFKLQRHHLKQLNLKLIYVNPHPHTRTKHPLS